MPTDIDQEIAALKRDLAESRREIERVRWLLVLSIVLAVAALIANVLVSIALAVNALGY